MFLKNKENKLLSSQITDSAIDAPKLKRYKTIGKKEIIILFLIFIACVLGSLFVYKTAVKPASQGIYAVPLQNSMDSIIQIKSDSNIQQKFIYDGEIAGIQLYFTTSGNSNDHGSIIVQLWETETNNKLGEAEVALSNIADRQPVSFRFNQFISCRSGEKYKLIVKPRNDFDSNCSLAICYNSFIDNSVNNLSNLYFNGKLSNGSIALTLLHTNIFIIKFFILFSVLVTLFFLFSYYILFILKTKTQLIFLLIAFSLGGLYLFILPPISAPDEDTHFATTYEYSNHFYGYFVDPQKDVIPETVNAHTLVNGEEHVHAHYQIAARETDAVAYSKLLKYPGIGQYRIIEEGMFQNAGNQNQINGEIQECVLSVSPIAYAPGILGVLIARLLGLGGIQLILLGRFFNLGFYILLAYFAVKIIPFGKVTLCSIALFPMMLHLAASFSYDAVLNGSAFLFIALVLSLAYGKPMCWYDVAVLIYCAMVFGSIKAIYMVLLLLVLIIPLENKFFKKKGIVIFITLLVIAISTFVISTLGNILTKNSNLVSVGEKYTYGYMVKHPIWFVFICVKSFISSLSYYLNSMIGGSLGWLELNVQWIIIIGFIFIVFLSMLAYQSTYELSPKVNLLVLIIFLGVTFGTYAAALTWNPIGASYINGVQGRYFLPVLPILLLSLQRNLQFIHLQKNIDNKLLYSIPILHVLTLSTVFQTIILR